jgi:3'(2'), 5'-bisphosphate nucleotidase
MNKPNVLTSLYTAVRAVLAGGNAILEVLRSGDASPETKHDGTPVTEADKQAEEAILAVLREGGTTWPLVAEELWDRRRAAGASGPAAVDPAVSEPRAPAPGAPWWAVDPLDGTKEFVKGLPEYTVNVALVQDTHPLLGVVYLPAFDRLYAGVVGYGAWRVDHASLAPTATPAPTPGRSQQTDAPEPVPAHWVPLPLPGPGAGPGARTPTPTTVAASRSHGTEDTAGFLRRLDSAGLSVKEYPLGSSAKFCAAAEGIADCYPRFTSTKVWDCAAGAGVLLAAGGAVTDHLGNPIVFDPVELLLPPLVAFRPGAPGALTDTVYAHLA